MAEQTASELRSAGGENSRFLAPLQVYLISLTSAFYLLRGLIEFPEIGWKNELLLTVAIGLVVLPLLASLASSQVRWRNAALFGLSLLGLAVNMSLLVVLWSGFSAVAIITVAISLLYAATCALAMTAARLDKRACR